VTCGRGICKEKGDRGEETRKEGGKENEKWGRAGDKLRIKN
jgi:hypothetical protein